MGFLRLLLASLVLASHTRSLAPVYAGVLAVECFFALSGFYMQMIVAERYIRQPNWRRQFLKSRLLRIFVPYWAILFIILLLSMLLHFLSLGALPPLLAALAEHPLSHQSLLGLFSNLFIVGSETIKLLRTGEGCDFTYWQHLIIPTAWSVGIELMFYASAPLLLACRSRVLVTVTLAGMAAKILLLWPQAERAFRWDCGDGLLNGIFPLDLCLFIAGALGYRFYAHRLALPGQPSGGNSYYYLVGTLAIATAIILALLDKNLSPQALLLSYYGYSLFIILMLPFLFKASRARHFDRMAGDLSYPFYLWHFFIVSQLMEHTHLGRFITFLSAELLSLAAAWCVMRWIETPLARFRHRKYYGQG